MVGVPAKKHQKTKKKIRGPGPPLRTAPRVESRPIGEVRNTLTSILAGSPEATLVEVATMYSARSTRPVGPGYVAAMLRNGGVHGVSAKLSREVERYIRPSVVGARLGGNSKKSAVKPAASRTTASTPQARPLRPDDGRLPQRHRTAHAFLEAAGLDVTIREDWVLVKGQKVVPAWHESTSWTRWINRFVADHLFDDLVASVRANLSGLPSGITGKRRLDGLALVLDDHELVRVRATAPVRARRVVGRGNYLTGGADWDTLRGLILKDVARLEMPTSRTASGGDERPISHAGVEEMPSAHAVAPRPPTVVVHRVFPESLAPAVSAAGTKASEQLRTARKLVCAHAVSVAIGRTTVTFRPLERHGEAIDVPVAFDTVGGTFDFRLRLSASTDPAPIVVDSTADLDALAPRWALALAAFAALTCRASLPTTSTTHQHSAGQTSQASGRGRTPSSARSGPAPGQTGTLVPAGQTRSWLRSYVVGHPRRLRPGHNAGRDAVARAKALGITLGPDETWVSPHARGLADDAVLEFAWTLPGAFAGARR